MIENHVTSLELSKKLKELGVKQSSFFYWTETDNAAGTGYDAYVFSGEDAMAWASPFRYSAFLSSELGELLPPKIDIENGDKQFTNGGIWKEEAHLVCGKFKTPEPLQAWYCDYQIYRPKPYDKQFELYHGEKAVTEADARAKMLIYLIQQRLVNTEDKK